jgi:hypothetical protein
MKGTERSPSPPPSIVIRFELERRSPTVHGVWMTEGDQRRILRWLEGQPQLLALIADAIKLASDVPADNLGAGPRA